MADQPLVGTICLTLDDLAVQVAGGARDAMGPRAGAGSLMGRSAAIVLLAIVIVIAESRVTGGQVVAGCASLTAPERALARLFEDAPEQRRRVRRCDPLLSRVARARALDMGTRGYFRHQTPEGEGPNRQLERAGYALPSFYGRRRSANNVEVIAAGDETAAEAWMGWIGSRSHRRQVLGLNPFFAEQIDYGVGHADVPRSRYGHYWVLITARH